MYEKLVYAVEEGGSFGIEWFVQSVFLIYFMLT